MTLKLFDGLWNIAHASWHAAVLALLVLLVQWAFRRQLAARWRFVLWFLVLARLSGVALPESRWSVYNWLPSTERAERLLPSGMRPVGHAAAEAHPEAGGAITPAASDRADAAEPFPWQTVILIVYGMGVTIVVGRVLLASLVLHRMLHRASPVANHPALGILEDARRKVGLRVSVRLFESSALASPAITGLLRPRLLIPPHVLQTFSPEQLRHVFMHECMHVRREDVLLNYWLALLSAVHWFNPVLWLALPRIRADRELACDEAVLARGEPAAAYGETLLKLAESSAGFRPLVGAVGVVETKTFFKRRIHMIASFRKAPAWLAVPALGVVVVLAGATLTSAVTAAAQTAAQAVGATQPAVRESGSAPSGEETELRRKLDMRLAGLSVDKLPLGKVLDFIQSSTGINLVVNWGALHDAKVDESTPISLNLKNIRVSAALDAVLQAANANPRLGIAVNDNVLEISTVQEMMSSAHAVTRVYDVRDLLEAAPQSPQLPDSGLNQQAAPPPNGKKPWPDTDVSDLISSVETAVFPDQWRDKGGESSSVREFKGALIVTAPPIVQDGVSQTLAQLGATLNKPVH